MHIKSTIGVAIMAIATMLPGAVLAEDSGGAERRFDSGKGNLHLRYPGDRAIAGGHARTEGPEQGVYIERCEWFANDTFYGLPWGFTQHCRRYTMDNTQ